MRGAHLLVLQRAVQEYFCLALDQRLYLGLPLLRLAVVWAGKRGENRFRPGRRAKNFVETGAGGHTVAALARQNERAPGFEYPHAGAHTFDSLVKVSVKRVPAVGGDHYV